MTTKNKTITKKKKKIIYKLQLYQYIHFVSALTCLTECESSHVVRAMQHEPEWSKNKRENSLKKYTE